MLLASVALVVAGVLACRPRSRDEAGGAQKGARELMQRADDGLQALKRRGADAVSLPVDETLSNRPSTGQTPVVQSPPPPAPPPPPPPAAPPAPDPDLNGIIWQQEKPLAIVGGVVVGRGDRVEGFTVVEITRETVVLRDDKGQTKALRLCDN